MKKYILLLLLVFLCGCSARDMSETETAESPTTQYADTEPAEYTTVAAQTTEPDNSISVPAGSHCRSYVDSDTGDYLDYYLFVPENAEKNMPLIVFLHGDGEVGDVEVLQDFGMIHSAREIFGEDFPFIAISPSTRVYSWISGTIPDTLKGLIDTISEECEIDPERIILTGHSRGAIGTWHMVSVYGDYFSAAVPVSGDYEGWLNYDNLSSIPIWTIAGSHDTYYLDSMHSLVDGIRWNGGDVQFSIIDDCYHGETSTRAYTAEVFEWMCAQ